MIRPTSTFSLGTFQIDGQSINPASITEVRSLSSNCSQMASYSGVFKTTAGAIALQLSPGADYTVTFPNHKVTRQVLVNICGYAVLKNTNTTSLNLPTATGVRADFTYANRTVASPLSCTSGTLYFPGGFNARSAIASATTTASTTTTTTTTTTPASTTTGSTSTVSAQTAQPKA